MWRMKNAFASQAPRGPSLGGWSAGERSLVFHRALIFRAGSLGCCRMPELGFALQTLFIFSYVSEARDAEWSRGNLFPHMV